MTCADVERCLGDVLDGHLSADALAPIQAHLTTCTACAGLLADFARLQGAARSLGPITPPDHIWLEIAGRIHLDAQTRPAAVSPASTTPLPASARRSSSDTWQWLGVAAALLVVTTAVYVASRPDAAAPMSSTSTESNVSAPATVETVEETLQRAQAEYERAIAQLETLVKSGDPGVSPETVATLQRSVTTIDKAIEESRAALTDNPTSQPARTSLFDALRSKVNLLQTTVVLMNEMRQGDAAGAAATASAGRGKSS
jgi:anti-sigma factor RsiW